MSTNSEEQRLAEEEEVQARIAAGYYEEVNDDQLERVLECIASAKNGLYSYFGQRKELSLCNDIFEKDRLLFGPKSSRNRVQLQQKVKYFATAPDNLHSELRRFGIKYTHRNPKPATAKKKKQTQIGHKTPSRKNKYTATNQTEQIEDSDAESMNIRPQKASSRNKHAATNQTERFEDSAVNMPPEIEEEEKELSRDQVLAKFDHYSKLSISDHRRKLNSKCLKATQLKKQSSMFVTETHEVDLKNPERNGNILITEWSEKTMAAEGGEVVNGLLFALLVFRRLRALYKLTLVSSTEIMLTHPTLAAILQLDHNEYSRDLAKRGCLDKDIHKGEQILLVDMEKDRHRKVEHTLLHFPFELSNEYFHPHAKWGSELEGRDIASAETELRVMPATETSPRTSVRSVTFKWTGVIRKVEEVKRFTTLPTKARPRRVKKDLWAEMDGPTRHNVYDLTEEADDEVTCASTPDEDRRTNKSTVDSANQSPAGKFHAARPSVQKRQPISKSRPSREKEVLLNTKQKTEQEMEAVALAKLQQEKEKYYLSVKKNNASMVQQATGIKMAQQKLLEKEKIITQQVIVEKNKLDQKEKELEKKNQDWLAMCQAREMDYQSKLLEFEQMKETLIRARNEAAQNIQVKSSELAEAERAAQHEKQKIEEAKNRLATLEARLHDQIAKVKQSEQAAQEQMAHQAEELENKRVVTKQAELRMAQLQAQHLIEKEELVRRQQEVANEKQRISQELDSTKARVQQAETEIAQKKAQQLNEEQQMAIRRQQLALEKEHLAQQRDLVLHEQNQLTQQRDSAQHEYAQQRDLVLHEQQKLEASKAEYNNYVINQSAQLDDRMAKTQEAEQHAEQVMLQQYQPNLQMAVINQQQKVMAMGLDQQQIQSMRYSQLQFTYPVRIDAPNFGFNSTPQAAEEWALPQLAKIGNEPDKLYSSASFGQAGFPEYTISDLEAPESRQAVMLLQNDEINEQEETDDFAMQSFHEVDEAHPTQEEFNKENELDGGFCVPEQFLQLEESLPLPRTIPDFHSDDMDSISFVSMSGVSAIRPNFADPFVPFEPDTEEDMSEEATEEMMKMSLMSGRMSHASQNQFESMNSKKAGTLNSIFEDLPATHDSAYHDEFFPTSAADTTKKSEEYATNNGFRSTVSASSSQLDDLVSETASASTHLDEMIQELQTEHSKHPLFPESVYNDNNINQEQSFSASTHDNEHQKQSFLSLPHHDGEASRQQTDYEGRNEVHDITDEASLERV